MILNCQDRFIHFTSKTGRVFYNYLVYYKEKHDFFFINEYDFINHKNLINISENTTDTFIIGLRGFSVNYNVEILDPFDEFYEIIEKENNKNKKIIKIIVPKGLIKSTKEVIGNKEQNDIILELSNNRNNNDAKKTSEVISVGTSGKPEISINQKVAFINNLFDYSLKKDVDDKTKNKLINLIKKEIEKTGGVEGEILERLEKIEDFISVEEKPKKKEEKLNTDKNSNKKISIKHFPFQTSDILKKFKFNNDSGLKELVHEPATGLQTSEEFDEILKRSENFFKGLKDIPYEMYIFIKELILLLENEGKNCVVKTNKHPYDNNDCDKIDEIKGKSIYKNITDNGYFFYISGILKNFKKNYRFDTERTESSILKELIENVFFYKEVFFDDDIQKKRFCFNSQKQIIDKKNINYPICEIKISFEPENFNSQASFFTWVPYVKSGLYEIAKNILKHGNINGNRNFKEKEVLFRIERVYEEISGIRKIYFTILDKGSINKKLPEVLYEQMSKSNFSEIYFKSICDWVIEYDLENNESYHIQLLPETNKSEAIKKLNKKSEGFKYILTFYD